MDALMDYVRDDDDVYFWRLDRVGFSVSQYLRMSIAEGSPPEARKYS
jgi:hypothetical protein